MVHFTLNVIYMDQVYHMFQSAVVLGEEFSRINPCKEYYLLFHGKLNNMNDTDSFNYKKDSSSCVHHNVCCFLYLSE